MIISTTWLLIEDRLACITWLTIDICGVRSEAGPRAVMQR